MNILRVNGIGALFLTALLWAAAAVPDAPVADAAMSGDLGAVRALVRQGADVNASQGDGTTALHWAAQTGNLEMAEVLIAAGARVAAVTRNGNYTPLHLASRQGHAEVLRVLMAAGADPQALTSTGAVTALHFAAATGNVEVVTALVDNGAQVNLAERQWGHTPLMFAAANNRVGAVEALLDGGADPEVLGIVIDIVKRDREDIARKNRHDGIQKVLGHIPTTGSASREWLNVPESVLDTITPGLRGNYSQRQSEDIKGYGGMTALTLAAREGHIETAMALLDRGADIDGVSGGEHTSPLLTAAINGRFDLAMMLLERGADVSLASDAGNAPLFATISTVWAPASRPPGPTYYAQQNTTHLELMEALLEAGADPNTRLNYNLWHIGLNQGLLHVDWKGATPLFRAAHGMDVPAMKLLVRYGADPNIPTIRPSTFSPVNDQALSGQGKAVAIATEPVEELDPSGLPVVLVGGPGFYPINAAAGLSHLRGLQGTIHRHADNGWGPSVKYLVGELGIDPNTRDHNGDVALHNAAFRGDDEMILYLVSMGADPLAVNRKGQTTVDKANGPIQRMEPYPETIELLESLGAINNHDCVSCK